MLLIFASKFRFGKKKKSKMGGGGGGVGEHWPPPWIRQWPEELEGTMLQLKSFCFVPFLVLLFILLKLFAGVLQNCRL